MKGLTLAAALLISLSFAASSRAQTAQPTEIIKIKREPLPIFETADTATLIRQIEGSELAGLPLPWPILDASDNGMYLIEIQGERVWIVNSTVKVDASATGTALAPESMNFSDQDLAGSRGYGD